MLLVAYYLLINFILIESQFAAHHLCWRTTKEFFVSFNQMLHGLIDTYRKEMETDHDTFKKMLTDMAVGPKCTNN